MRGTTVVFDGDLYNGLEIAQQLSINPQPTATLIALAYERWGVDVVHRLRGLYALVLHDTGRQTTLGVRDPLGAFPLFYAEANGSVLLSASIDALRNEPGVSRAFNRAALADHLSHRWPDQQETFFESIRRVPPGYMLTATPSSTRVARYWDPVPLDRPIEWLPDEEVQPRFDAAFEKAVCRTLDAGPTGIFLSGGLDSISVAAMATDGARRTNRPSPLALSLGFSGDVGEEKEQKGVAAKLGLQQEFVDFYDAAPAHGLLAAALECTVQQPSPLLNTWMPAYSSLARRGVVRGVRAILSGAGGDEWLSASPFIGADMLRSGNAVGLARLIGAWRRSYNLTLGYSAQILLWSFGARPLASAAMNAIAPGAWRVSRVNRGIAGTRPWVAGDAALRRELDERVAQYLPNPNPPGGFYLHDVRASLEHPLTVLELEEIFEHGRRLDVRFLHPYWDADVVDTMYRTRPLHLFTGGRAKSVVRRTMANRFPGLGLEHQKKRSGTGFYARVLDREIPALWARHRAIPALKDLGIVDGTKAIAMADRSVESKTGTGLVSIWDLMNLDVWVQAHH